MTTWKRKYLKKKTKGGFYWKKEKKNREEILHEKKKTLKSKEIDFTLKKKVLHVFKWSLESQYSILIK